MGDVNKLREEFVRECKGLSSLKQLNDLRIRYLGKKGLLTQRLKALSALSPAERPAAGKEINILKRYVEAEIKRLEGELSSLESRKKVATESIDITLPGKYIPAGSRHPVNRVLDEIVDIFLFMGFTVEEGPEVELDHYNFEALNIPRDHPARDMQDTFYVKTDGERQSSSSTGDGGDKREAETDVVLRTHTSPVQIRVMEKQKPPLRFIAPGKVYRCDSDVSHTPMFHQVEGLMVGEDITFSHVKSVLKLFVHSLFSVDTPVRFRPSYFPFTEPSAEIDIGCVLCKGAGCRVCKGTGWIEVLGAGMVHPKVFEGVGYDTEKYTGFAFGMGVERLTMLKYGIDDIRLFYENDLRFLRQF
ncbi:MAG TPA: phenylalanine--tRNA ligase subunit alpha [Nitrospirae bacterium]|nr:phenylalanine--tRNA ligase subunit alpha [Nitrospirota bacterium]